MLSIPVKASRAAEIPEELVEFCTVPVSVAEVVVPFVKLSAALGWIEPSAMATPDPAGLMFVNKLAVAVFKKSWSESAFEDREAKEKS